MTVASVSSTDWSQLPAKGEPCRGPKFLLRAGVAPRHAGGQEDSGHWSPPRISSHGHHLLKSQVPTKEPGARPTMALRGDVICSGSQHWGPDVHFLVCRTSPQGSQQQGHLDTALEGSSGDRGAGLVGAQEAGHWRTACAHGVPACSSSGASSGELALRQDPKASQRQRMCNSWDICPGTQNGGVWVFSHLLLHSFPHSFIHPRIGALSLMGRLCGGSWSCRWKPGQGGSLPAGSSPRAQRCSEDGE